MFLWANARPSCASGFHVQLEASLRLMETQRHAAELRVQTARSELRWEIPSGKLT